MIPRFWLAPFSLGYAAGLFLWEEAYRRGILPTERLSVPVIGVGGITVGGAGKTPTTLCILESLIRKGLTPGVLTRGYGRREKTPEPFLFRGNEGFSTDVTGDEPAMMSRRFPEVLFCISADRAKGGQALVDRGANVVLLDDGFQSLELYQDLRVVLLPEKKLSSGISSLFHLLPAGDLRDFPGRLKQADVLVRLEQAMEKEHPDAAPDFPDCYRVFLSPGSVFMSATVRPSALLGRDGRFSPVEELRGKNVVLVSGIARPQRFRRMAESCGARVLGHLELPDHVLYTNAILSRIRSWIQEIESTGQSEIHQVLVTEKDWVKLCRYSERDSRVQAFIVRMDWNDSAQWEKLLEEKPGRAS
ncbi:MAG: tetraacyldisaccharide 4'-kinase [Nitrospirae bacterium]|nr:tetraacyldisaccharide 4'-kinase [Nitrospirota bacterium]